MAGSSEPTREEKALGDQAAISKSTVPAICQQIKDEYEAWSQRLLHPFRAENRRSS